MTVGRMNAEQRSEWNKVYNPINEDFMKQYPKMSKEELMRWRYQRYMQDYLGYITSVKRHYGIVTEKYKLVHFYYDVDEWELYDRMNDKNEMKNVYNDPKYAKIKEILHEKLVALRLKYKDSEAIDKKVFN